jgi:hypothetical protein
VDQPHAQLSEEVDHGPRHCECADMSGGMSARRVVVV